MGSEMCIRDRSTSDVEILFRGTLLWNMLYGNKELSSFEMVRGYTPTLVCLLQNPLSKVIVSSHDEQVARRELNLFRRSKNPTFRLHRTNQRTMKFISSSEELSSAYGRSHSFEIFSQSFSPFPAHCNIELNVVQHPW